MLVAGGADLTAKDPFGYAPIHHAVERRHTDVFRPLLEGAESKKGMVYAQIMARTPSGYKPLDLALRDETHAPDGNIINRLKKAHANHTWGKETRSGARLETDEEAAERKKREQRDAEKNKGGKK